MSYIITGTPGVGKHTIANMIKKSIKLPVLDINQIAKESGLFEKSNDTNDVDSEQLKKILDEKISVPTIIVGHLAPYVISPELAKKVIVLRRNPYDLVPIYKKRRYSEEKIKENVGSEILGIIFNDSLQVFGNEKIAQIEISDDLVSNVKKVLQNIQGRHNSDSVDWLEMVKENDDLKEFFSY